MNHIYLFFLLQFSVANGINSVIYEAFYVLHTDTLPLTPEEEPNFCYDSYAFYLAKSCLQRQNIQQISDLFHRYHICHLLIITAQCLNTTGNRSVNVRIFVSSLSDTELQKRQPWPGRLTREIQRLEWCIKVLCDSSVWTETSLLWFN
jgi:hypothetical protein